MRSALILFLLTVPGTALAAPAKDGDARKIVCAKLVDSRIPQRDRRPECRVPKTIPAIFDLTPVFIL